MSFVYKIDVAAGILCKRGVGEVTAYDLRKQFREEMRHPDFHPGLDRIMDYRQLHPRLSLDELSGLAHTLRGFEPVLGDCRWAVVTDLDVVYGQMRKFITLLEGTKIQVKVFWGMEEAKAWLGLADDYQCPLVTPEAV